mmetsp:Transcript_9630/g.16033  ORF Transcript_9630/g.16033 Transcript_9630/m.16033 type:complete len:311 (-) Transcript_9630:286-1218(-)
MLNYLRPNKFLRPVGPVVKGSVSPMLSVPGNIKTTEYAKTGTPYNASHVLAMYNEREIPKIRAAAHLARKMLEFSLSLAKPGRTTDEIDRMTHEEIVKNGAYPTPLNYYTFPKSICTSVNEVVCHGIPDDRELVDGDIVSIDVSLFTQGYHGDNCGTVVVGQPPNADEEQRLKRLIDTTKHSVMSAAGICKPGACISEIGEVIEDLAVKNDYGVVHNFCGHGTGRNIHMAPLILHYKNKEAFRMQPGMVFTIEPILTEGSSKIVSWSDGWTASTRDGGWSAQIEHEILITEDGAEVLTVFEDEDGVKYDW